MMRSLSQWCGWFLCLQHASLTSVPLQFIAVHIRRADFKDKCKGQDLDQCMAPLSAYERRVKQVQEELINIYGAESPQATASQRILVASDETDPAWWETVREKGWSFVDHEKEATSAKYGVWCVAFPRR